ncbi:MAG: cell division protein SepF [Candidatus Bathyarchaeota archaeon]|nr:cell division protein SepF [Candidatus Termiticorpusculum sp.]
MPSFGLFNKQKKQDTTGQTDTNIQKNSFEQTNDTTVVPKDVQVEEKPSNDMLSVAPENQHIVMAASPEISIVEPTKYETAAQFTDVCKMYLKAVPLRDLSDIEAIKTELQSGNILILRITPLASKSVESVKSAVNELYAFTESIGGDIARLGEERIVICPKNIRIWREKMPEKNELLLSSTAA